MQGGSKQGKKVSPYFSFCKAERERVKAELVSKGEPTSVPVLAKALSSLWRSLTEEQRNSYKHPQCSLQDHVSGQHMPDGSKVGANKVGSSGEENEAEVEAEAEAGAEVEVEEEEEVNTEHSEEPAVLPFFPLARVKRIMKLDKDVRLVPAEVAFTVDRAVKLFLEHLACTASEAAAKRKRRTVRLDDLRQAIKTEGRVRDFLGDVLDDLLSIGNDDDGNSDNEGDEEEGGEDKEEKETVRRRKGGAEVEPSNAGGKCEISDSAEKKKKQKHRKSGPAHATAPAIGIRCIKDFFGGSKSGLEAAPDAAAFQAEDNHVA